MPFGALVQAQLAAMIAAWLATYSHLKLCLFTNNETVDSTTDLSTLIEPTASWYAEKAPTFGGVLDTPDHGFTLNGVSAQWTYSGSDAPTTVYGWFLLDAGAGPGPITYLAAGNFATPVTIQSEWDGVVVEPALYFPPVEQAAVAA